MTMLAQEHEANLERLRLERMVQQTAVVLNNAEEILPLKNLDQKIACIDLGFNHSPVFDSLVNKYQRVDHFNGNFYASTSSLDALLDDLKYYKTLILEISDVSAFDQRVLNFIAEVGQRKQVIIALFGDARSLVKLDPFKYPLIWSEQHNDAAARVVAQAIFGGLALDNYLKQDYGQNFCTGSGYRIRKTRLAYTVPEAVGINADNLAGIAQVANEAIAAKATPSAVVMVVKSGQVIYHQAFGKPTYQSSRATHIDDIYDLASITKTAATTPAVMHIVDEEKLRLDAPLGTYLGRSRGLDKSAISVREVLLHQAGFVPFIPFYLKLNPEDYRSDSSAAFSTRVATNYYLRNNYFAEVMWPQMLRSPLQNRGRYVYSDLSMYMMKEIVEKLAEKPLSQYVQEQFYRPLGMQRAGYHPLNRFPAENIIPTEEDKIFRKTMLQGDVHDQGAAMLGGAAGHAGLFSSANDLAILYQLFLNKGTYGGQRYFKTSTVELFTSSQSSISRRGLGFDRWDPDTTKQYPSRLASPQTFGHTGYTGTCVWADPANDLIYIFLSNRVYPQVSEKLSNMRIRPRIQDVIYEAIAKGEN
ncbi:MAG: hypothetical protein RI924_424 [Bacteroidota bacterium]